jgi:autotransporter-associated beta strand protein
MGGASLTIIGGNLGAGTVAGGAGVNGGGNGQAFGGGLFLEGAETITLAPAAATAEIISGVIADEFGSGATFGVGLILDGLGTVDLAAANTFTGGVTVDKGTLELSNSAAAGSGAITIAKGANAIIEMDDDAFAPNPIAGFATGDAITFVGAGSATLAAPAGGGAIDFAPTAVDYALLESGATLGARIANFGIGDAVEFEAVKYSSSDKVSYASGVVSIKNSAATVASFDVSGRHTAANFALENDGLGHLVVTDPRRRERSAAEPSWTRASDASAFDSWALLSSRAGSYRDSLAQRDDGNVGGAHDAWALGAGSDAPIGHRPGPGS